MSERSKTGGGRISTAGVLFNYGLARIVPGLAVPRLVTALGSENEDTATAAYMALVKLGPRVCDHLLQAARAGRETAGVLRLLGDMGDRSLIPEVEPFLEAPDPAVAEAARESVEMLSRREENPG